jgi:hypothetical protein
VVGIKSRGCEGDCARSLLLIPVLERPMSNSFPSLAAATPFALAPYKEFVGKWVELLFFFFPLIIKFWF